MFQIAWYDPIDGTKEYASRAYPTVRDAALAAGRATLEHGIDMVFDIVVAKTHRIVDGWREQVPDLETL